MKKILVLALCAVAGFASAGSIQWKLNMGRNGFISDSNGDAMTGSLYLLLTDDATSLADTVADNLFASTLENKKLDTMDLTNGKNTSIVTTTSPDLTVGETYSFSLVVFDTANAQYYVSSALQQKAYDEGADVVSPNMITFTTQMVGNSFSASWSPTTPAVPEPSSAMLGLLGLGLLLKRRKA